jgi:putative ATP-dependent endonuclease of the OLD family
MLLKTITIQNFRGIGDLTVELGPTTVLIGENNVGKTTLFDAVRLALSRAITRRTTYSFDDDDYHLSGKEATARDAPPLHIRLDFAEATVGEWPKELIQRLQPVIVIDDDSLQHIVLRVDSGFDTAANDFVTDWKFADIDGTILGQKAQTPTLFSALLQFVPTHYLSAVRDAKTEFGSRGTFFGAYIKNPALPKEVRDDLQQKLADINTAVIEAHTTLRELRENLTKAQRIVALGSADKVDIEAVPARVSDLLAKTQVSITSVTGASLPLARHGAGTQSLAVLFLFESFVKTFQSGAAVPASLLLLEEPETHLHPNAVRALWPAVAALPGQKIVSTHSGDLLARVPIGQVRRLYRRGGVVRVGSVGEATLTDAQRSKIDFHVRNSRGELLFASTWLLGEGETEFWIYEEAAALLGVSLDELGVRFVNFKWSGAEPLLKVANALGISWFLTGDGDSEGTKLVKTATAHLDGRAAADHIHQLPFRTIENCLAENGYGAIFESHISAQKKSSITAAAGDPAYWDQVLRAGDDKSKPLVAQEIAEEMRKRGRGGIPADIQLVIDRVKVLATS